MKVVYKVGNLVIDLEAKDQCDLMKQTSDLDEVFGNTVCGKCNSTDIRPVVRDNAGNTYYEFRCKKCRARLALGVHNNNNGTLFPKRKDDSGNTKGVNGWVRWNPETKIEE